MGAKADPRASGVVTTVDALASRITALEAQLRSVTTELAVARQLYHLIGHEVRTPLTVVLGVLSTLESADVPAAERRRLQGRALAHARRLRDVVDDLLADDPPARTTVPRAAIETVAVAPLLRAACAAVPRRRLAFHVSETLLVATEPTRLWAIVSDVVDTAAAHSLGRIEIGARRTAREIIISVADQGPGRGGRPHPAASDAVAVGPTRHRSPDLARLLAHSLGGELTVGEGPHGGPLTTVRLPQRRGDDPASAPRTAAAAAAGTGRARRRVATGARA
jgi:K+-sensing histidine kinase KdpD